MYRQESQTAQSLLSLTNPKGSSDAQRSAKSLPSGSQLPSCWNGNMDRALCLMDAENNVDVRHMPKHLKRSFPELERSSISVEALQRRLESLDLQDNDYFKAGMEAAVEKAEKNGLVLPEYDPRNYPSKPYPMKSDLEVFGNGTPMTGLLGFGASNNAESGDFPRRVGKITVGGRLRMSDKRPTPVQSPAPLGSPARHVSARSEGLGIRRVQLAGEYSHPHNLTDITNTYNAPGLPATSSNYRDPSSRPATSSHHGKSAVNAALPTPSSTPSVQSPEPVASGPHGKSTISTVPPSTPVNSQGAEHFATPSSRDKHRGIVGASNASSNQHQSTPSRKNRSHSKVEAGNTSVAANGSSRDIYRSGKENATSGMSTSTTGTSILGREISGMSAAMERRHAKIDQRVSAAD